MSSSPTLLTEFLVAELAGERLLAGVYPLMGDALAVVPELLRAVLAAVLFGCWAALQAEYQRDQESLSSTAGEEEEGSNTTKKKSPNSGGSKEILSRGVESPRRTFPNCPGCFATVCVKMNKD